MTKQLRFYLIISIIIISIGYYIHAILFSGFADKSSISLNYVYGFFGTFTILLCIIFSILYHTNRFKSQIGFLYLASVAVKIVLFSIIFSKQLFTVDSSFPKQEAVNLLIPIMLTLAIEIFFISKLLNNSARQKNAK